jgi:hypothetical protein
MKGSPIRNTVLCPIAVCARLSSSLFAAIFGMLMLFAGYAGASTIYSSGSPNFVGPGVDLGLGVAAESFTLSTTTTIRGAQFYTYGTLQYFWDRTLNYFFFRNNGGFPAASPLFSGFSPPSTQTPLADGVTLFSFDLITPVTLAPGTYWLGIQTDGPLDGAGLAWDATTTPYAQASAWAMRGNFTQWSLQGSQLAFSLSDTPLVAPEPATAAITAIGLTVVFWNLKKARNNCS